jgi:carbon monoxide dehydrogenase subunit G
MNYDGTVTFKAEPLAVWDVVLDIDQFAECMPGVENIVKVDERTFDGTMRAKVGPISGNFNFRAQIVESEPPIRLKAEVEGTDSLTKSTMTSDITMTLAAGADGETVLTYQAEVRIKGRLAIIGDMVIRATGAQVIEVFFDNLRDKVEGERSPIAEA